MHAWPDCLTLMCGISWGALSPLASRMERPPDVWSPPIQCPPSRTESSACPMFALARLTSPRRPHQLHHARHGGRVCASGRQPNHAHAQPVRRGGSSTLVRLEPPAWLPPGQVTQCPVCPMGVGEAPPQLHRLGLRAAKRAFACVSGQVARPGIEGVWGPCNTGVRPIVRACGRARAWPLVRAGRVSGWCEAGTAASTCLGPLKARHLFIRQFQREAQRSGQLIMRRGTRIQARAHGSHHLLERSAPLASGAEPRGWQSLGPSPALEHVCELLH